MRTEKKMYLVKREVIATSVEQAIRSKGRVYCVELAEEKDWGIKPKKPLGFIPKK